MYTSPLYKEFKVELFGERDGEREREGSNPVRRSDAKKSKDYFPVFSCCVTINLRELELHELHQIMAK